MGYTNLLLTYWDIQVQEIVILKANLLITHQHDPKLPWWWLVAGVCNVSGAILGTISEISVNKKQSEHP